MNNGACIVLGIAGGSASGKTTVVDRLVRTLDAQTVSVIEHDRYYKHFPELPDSARAALNYDHPDALDTDLLIEHIAALKAGRVIEVPVYDFVRHVRRAERQRIEPRPTIIVEGILVLADMRLVGTMDVRVFVDTPDDLRFERRLARDVRDRGRDPESVRAQYESTVRPMHAQFVEPSRRHADVIVTEGGFDDLGIQRILQTVITAHADRHR